MNIFENFETTIQWTEEFARTQVDSDPEAFDEESGADEVNWAIGESRQDVELDDWGDMPSNFEPAYESDREEYYEYLQNKEEDEDY